MTFKFKVGDKVRHKTTKDFGAPVGFPSTPVTIEAIYLDMLYFVENPGGWLADRF